MVGGGGGGGVGKQEKKKRPTISTKMFGTRDLTRL